MNRCARTWLVSESFAFPQAEHDFNWPEADIIIGCNQLVCDRCGDKVRSRANVMLRDPVKWQRLLSEDWQPLIEERDFGRLYVCRCGWESERHRRDLDDDADWEMSRWHPAWRCGGHPLLALPTNLDGIPLGDDTDWQELVTRELRHGLERQMADPALAEVWLSRLYWLLAHTPHAARIAGVVLDSLRDGDAGVRMEAIDFFRQNPSAPGAEELSERLRADRALYAAVPNPYGKDDLYFHLLQAVAKRATLGDLGARAVAREELLRPEKKPGFLVAQMLRYDRKWLEDHQQQIVGVDLDLAQLLRR